MKTTKTNWRRTLHSGDEVTYTSGKTSKTGIINTIQYDDEDDIAFIIWNDGTEDECYLYELS